MPVIDDALQLFENILTSIRERKRLNLLSLVRISPMVLSTNWKKKRKQTWWIFTFTPQRVDSVGTDLFIAKGPFRESFHNWPVDDVDDAIGCRQVRLHDGVQRAGVVHQDKPLHPRQKQHTFVITSVYYSGFWLFFFITRPSLISLMKFIQLSLVSKTF